jgi:CHAT domain-containing protein
MDETQAHLNDLKRKVEEDRHLS